MFVPTLLLLYRRQMKWLKPKSLRSTERNCRQLRRKRTNTDSSMKMTFLRMKWMPQAANLECSALSDLGNCIVKLKAVVARKIVLSENAAGRAIKAIWRLGVEGCTREVIAQATVNLGRDDRRIFQLSHRRMPGWMSDMVHNFGRGFAQRRELFQG